MTTPRAVAAGDELPGSPAAAARVAQLPPTQPEHSSPQHSSPAGPGASHEAASTPGRDTRAADRPPGSAPAPHHEVPRDSDAIASLSPCLVVGAGLVGASIGMALTRAGVRVHVSDHDRSHALVAASLGAGGVEVPDAGAVRLVVVAVPPAAVAEVVADSLRRHPGAVVTDVASVKGEVLRQVAGRVRTAPELARYVGSHPMAGSQHSGPLTASADLFVDRTWVVSAHPRTSPPMVERVRRMATLCGARVVDMEPDEHDEAVALVSHLPQLVSSLTAARLASAPEQHLRLAGQGVRDVTRVAGSDPQLWRQIIAANGSAVRQQLAAVRADLDHLLAHLDDDAAVEDVIARGRDGVRALPGKHGQRAVAYRPVVVEIPDAPGALARLFADVDAAGANVEDLTIEHDETREVGYLSIAVTVDAAPRLARAMAERGWVVRP